MAIVVLILVLGVTVGVAGVRWRAATTALIGRLGSTTGHAAPAPDLAREIDGLPQPVARYFRLVLGTHPPLVRTARATWRGDFLLRPGPSGWRSFRATQVYRTRPPGFVWSARIRMAPGIDVLVRDAFVDGGGVMRGAILGVLPVVDTHGTAELAAAALQRYLGEAVWFPTGLLPRYGVQWTPLTDSTARASLTVASTSVSLDFRFGRDGLVESIYSAARFRDVDGTAVPTPWEARVGQYVEHAGLKVPSTGEAAWLPPDGRQAYWRGTLVDLAYERDER